MSMDTLEAIRPGSCCVWEMIKPMKVSATRLQRRSGPWSWIFRSLGVTNTFLLIATQTDMFRALLKTDLPKENVFACTVGASSKRTLATWHLLEPSDVIASIAALSKQENL